MIEVKRVREIKGEEDDEESTEEEGEGSESTVQTSIWQGIV